MALLVIGTFSIKDPDSVLNCAMFRLQNINLRFKPKEGDQVILQGKLSIYKKTGRYQMKVEQDGTCWFWRINASL